MAWLRGRVALGSFPDLAGAVNKISESVKNIEKNFDNALGLEDQPGASTSTDEASQIWSPELMAFTGPKDGIATAKSSKKLDSSKEHESSSHPSFRKEKEGADANTTEERVSPAREASEETSNPEEKHGADAEDSINSTEEHLPPVTEASVETLNPEEHQDHPVETQVKIPEETDSNAEKPVDANTVRDQAEKTDEETIATSHEAISVASNHIEVEADSQAKPSAENIDDKPVETNMATSHEATAVADNRIEVEADSQAKPSAENIDDKPVETNMATSHEGTAAADNHIEVEADSQAKPSTENIDEKPVETNIATSHDATADADNHDDVEADSQARPSAADDMETEFLNHAQHLENPEIASTKNSGSIEDESKTIVGQVPTTSPERNKAQAAPVMQKSDHELNMQDKMTTQEDSAVEGVDSSNDDQSAVESGPIGSQSPAPEVFDSVEEGQPHFLPSSDNASERVPEVVSEDDNEYAKVHMVNQLAGDDHRDQKEQHMNSGSNLSDNADSVVELKKLKKEMKTMETALLGAARQAQAKADEIAKLMNENEQLKSIIEDQRRKSNEAEMESLREEYHQRVSTLERKVYALMRERDTLRREQTKKNDAAALLKEKDEIITQVMAEGEELSKKQAVQESTIRKLRAQVREYEEEKKGLVTKLQVEENKVESIKRDKAATEKLLQETIEKNQAELATQKEYYMNALSAAKEEKALAEARANDEARTELESHLREAKEREALLVQTLEELRQTLSRKEQQAVFREDMLRRDINDLQKRYQASERRCEELVLQVPESTRPLLRQIEVMQETTARKAEAWAAVERSLNIRLQEAEAKALAAEERERSVNERLSQTLSRINVLEAQISCLRAEQTQLTRSLEKERQRASESRQEYLALKEEADTHKGHVNQLEEETRELKKKHKRELQEALTHRELLQQDLEREKAARLELEKTARSQLPPGPGQGSIAKTKAASENGLTRRLSSASSLSSMEESFYLQASLDSSYTFSERSPREPPISPYHFKSMTPHAFEAALRQKEGEIASYMSRLASMESIRDSLSEELVKMTGECEKLRSEVVVLPSIKAELEALRVRHSAALELMGERDEELEELRADIVDLKEMYREQVNMLVNKIQKCSTIDVA